MHTFLDLVYIDYVWEKVWNCCMYNKCMGLPYYFLEYSRPSINPLPRILVLQAHDKAAMLGVKTIDFFLKEFTWK